MIKPYQTLGFVFLVMSILAGVIFIMPANGISIGEFKIDMPTFGELSGVEKSDYADISDIVAAESLVNSLETNMSLAPEQQAVSPEPLPETAASYDELVKKTLRIAFSPNDAIRLAPFFRKISEGKPVRVMHYGDSQIEGDRITSFIRGRLQQKYGGGGPGLISVVQPYNFSFTLKQENIGSWYRYTLNGPRDTSVKHNKFGALFAFSRLINVSNDSLLVASDTTTYESVVKFGESKSAYGTTRNFNQCRIFYRNANVPATVRALSGDTLLWTAVLQKQTEFSTLVINFKRNYKDLDLVFKAIGGSPDIFGVELSLANKGVLVDNIALRGNSGTTFSKVESSNLVKMYEALKPDLFLLQFGGNVMPYMKDEAQATTYARSVKSQIVLLKRVCPNAVVVFIGPSDMSYKNKDRYETYPMLPAVRDALKKVALDAGAGYWDMFEAMGGINSMPSWVNARPQLAGSDYVHFTPKGANLVANMFFNALIVEEAKAKK